MTENFLYKALLISLGLHSAILCLAYFHRVHTHYGLKQNRIEISYEPHYKKPVDIREHPIRPSQHLDFRSDPRLFSDGAIPVSLSKDKTALPFAMLDDHDSSEHMRSMELSRRVVITPIKSEKINNPVYAAYNQIVHDRIQERVYANYDRLEGGVVYLTFLLDNHGNLVEARIIPEKTNASEHLQESALKSLREAGPFPPFLRGMSLNEYPFSIQIEYHVSGD